MDPYPLVKLIHILSATVLLGTGAGIAFFMLRAWQSGDENTLRASTRHVVQADWFFTTPAVIIQILSGIWLVHRLSVPLDSIWLWTVLGLFAFVGGCWLPVVWIQVRIRNMLSTGADRSAIRPLMRWWIGLGVPAFLTVLALFALMVYKPWMYVTIGGQQN